MVPCHRRRRHRHRSSCSSANDCSHCSRCYSSATSCCPQKRSPAVVVVVVVARLTAAVAVAVVVVGACWPSCCCDDATAAAVVAAAAVVVAVVGVAERRLDSFDADGWEEADADEGAEVAWNEVAGADVVACVDAAAAAAAWRDVAVAFRCQASHSDRQSVEAAAVAAAGR